MSLRSVLRRTCPDCRGRLATAGTSTSAQGPKGTRLSCACGASFIVEMDEADPGPRGYTDRNGRHRSTNPLVLRVRPR